MCYIYNVDRINPGKKEAKMDNLKTLDKQQLIELIHALQEESKKWELMYKVEHQGLEAILNRQ